MVSKALAKNYGTGDVSDGKAFLEKIVQLPLRIPYTNDQERFDYTINLFNDWLNTSKIKLPDKYQSQFVGKFRGLHDSFIRTPRDAKRLLNSVSFSYQCLKDEICIYDIILLETFRIFTPLVFNELIVSKVHLFSKPLDQNGYTTIHRDIREIGKRFNDRISSYIEAISSIQGAVDFMFPANDIYNVGWDTSRDEKSSDLFRYQRVGIQKYFDRFIEFKIGKQDISDTEFKEILNLINTKEYSLAIMDIKRLLNFPQQSIFILFLYVMGQLTEIGKVNVIKMLCTIQYLFRDTTVEGRFFHRPTKLSLEFLENLPKDKKISTLKFIIENCERINHAALLIWHLQRGFGKEKKFKFEPESEVAIVAQEFVSKVQSLSIDSFFENVDDEKNDILFIHIEKYGDMNKLKTDLANFIQLNPKNGLLVIKSLIQMTYYNFSQSGVYGHEIRHDNFETIDQYVSREVLKNISYQLFPEFKDNLPQSDFFEEGLSQDKSIIIQYLNHIKKTE
jgi:hypothetical protein